MPVYEYRCNACGHQFEVVQRMSDDPIKDCEVCSGEVARVLFAPAIHFKGTGFHNTDYGTRKRPKDGDTSGGEGGSSSGSEGGSTSGEGGSSSGEGGSSSGSDGGGSGGSKNGDAPKAKEAKPKDTAARTAGP